MSLQSKPTIHIIGHNYVPVSTCDQSVRYLYTCSDLNIWLTSRTVGYLFIYPDSHIRLTSPKFCFTNYDSQMWFTKRIIVDITRFPDMTCQLDICSCILILFTCRIFAHVSFLTNIHQARGYATHHPWTFFVHHTIHIAIYCWKTKMSAFIICQWTWSILRKFE